MLELEVTCARIIKYPLFNLKVVFVPKIEIKKGINIELRMYLQIKQATVFCRFLKLSEQ